MKNFKNGDKVKWISKGHMVPHPDGKCDRVGKVLSVFRDTELTGDLIMRSGKSWYVRPSNTKENNDKFFEDKFYDVIIEEEFLNLV